MISFQIICLIGIDYKVPDIQECFSWAALLFTWHIGYIWMAEVPIADSVIIKDISFTRQALQDFFLVYTIEYRDCFSIMITFSW